jgi:hypothetical protein
MVALRLELFTSMGVLQVLDVSGQRLHLRYKLVTAAKGAEASARQPGQGGGGGSHGQE